MADKQIMPQRVSYAHVVLAAAVFLVIGVAVGYLYGSSGHAVHGATTATTQPISVAGSASTTSTAAKTTTASTVYEGNCTPVYGIGPTGNYSIGCANVTIDQKGDLSMTFLPENITTYNMEIGCAAGVTQASTFYAVSSNGVVGKQDITGGEWKNGSAITVMNFSCQGFAVPLAPGKLVNGSIWFYYSTNFTQGLTLWPGPLFTARVS